MSVTTVSHAINGSRQVHPQTTARIQHAVETLDYRPNILARSLRRRRTHTVGLLVSDIEVPFFTEVARAVETAAHERGYSLVLCNTDEDPVKEALYAEVLLGKQVDGLIVAPSPGDHAHLRKHIARGARVVLVNREVPTLDTPAVIFDDTDAIARLAGRLIEDGHRRLGVVVGLPGIPTTERRLTGFRRALEAAGLDPDGAWAFPGDGRQESGRRAALALAALTDPPTAIVCFNTAMIDGLLLGLLDVAPELIGRLVVTGFGYSPVARMARVSPYTLVPPTRELGCAAATLLLDGLEDAGAWRNETTVLEVPLIHYARER